jgi:hypothetical protein
VKIVSNNHRMKRLAPSSGQETVLWTLPAHVRERLDNEAKSRKIAIRRPGYSDKLRTFFASLSWVFGQTGRKTGQGENHAG